MNLLNKLSVGMARIGCVGLRNASEQNKDNLDYVKAVVSVQGARSFQFASDRIRSDAKSILEMVEFNPEILCYIKKDIFDRSNGLTETEKVDNVLFALKCMELNVDSFAYLPEEIQVKLVNVFKTKNIYMGKLLGEIYSFNLDDFRKDEELMFLLDYVESYIG